MAGAEVAESVIQGLSKRNPEFTSFKAMEAEANKEDVAQALAHVGESFRTSAMWTTVVDTIAGTISSPLRGCKSVITEHLDFYICQLCTVIRDKRTHTSRGGQGAKWTLASNEQILMIHDISVARAVARYLTALSGQQGSPFMPDVSTIDSVFSWGDQILEHAGNDGYKVVKELEPVCVGVYLRDYDVLPGKERFIANGVDGAPIIDESDPGFSQRALLKLVNIVEKCRTPAEISEIFGLNRLFGFPTIDEDAAIANVRKIATPPTMSPAEVEAMKQVSRRSTAALTKYYCLSYIRRYGRWPPVEHPGSNEVLKRWIETNTTNLNLIQDRGPSLDEWGEITLGKQVDFDYFDDASLLLSDTALSPGRSEFDCVYSSEFLGYQPPAQTTSRRTMVEYLARGNLNTREILRKISTGEMPKDDFVVGLRTKERELAIPPRCYGMLTLELRTYFVLTE